MSKSGTLWRWIGIAALLVLGLAIPKWMSSRAKSSADVAEPIAQRVPVEIEQVTVGRLEERLVTSGTILANERVAIVSEIAGKVEDILFEEGSLVERGVVLVRLDTSTLEAERDRARYRVDLLQLQEARQRQLLEDGLISQEEYDSTLGELNVLQAELELREAQLAKAEIRAPFAGVIGLRSVSPGAFVTSQTRVATLQDIDPVKVEFSVPEVYAGELRVGDTVRFSLKGMSDEIDGRIYAIEPAIDPGTRSLTLRATAPNPDRTLLPGSFAEVEVAVRDVPEAISVPAMAVVPELGGKKVFVLEQGVAQPRIVETGIRTEDRVQIVRGLKVGEQVIVSNVARLRAGTEVEVAPGSENRS